MKYLFAMMDDETRFWIAQQVADTKLTADVWPLFAEAKEKAGKRALTLTTDGAHHFIPASEGIWPLNTEIPAVHPRHQARRDESTTTRWSG